MKKRLMFLAPLGAIATFILRRLQLAGSFDAQGLPIAGDTVSILLYVLCAVFAAAILLCCKLEPKAAAPAPAGKSPLRGIAVIVSALLLVASNIPSDFSIGLKLIVPLLALAAACAMAVEGVFHMQGQSASLLGGCVLPIYLAALLIGDYRAWSYDPIVAHFCFKILFLVSAMLSAYHLAAFRVGKGKRRLTAFFTACAIGFAGPVLADGLWPTIARAIALCIYLAAEFLPYAAAPSQTLAEDAD